MATLSSDTAQAMLEAVITKLNTGSGDRTLSIYTSADVLLCTFVLPGYTAASNACPSIAAISSTGIFTDAVASGTADYGLVTDRNGATKITVTDVDTTGSGSAIELSSLTVDDGQPLRLDNFTLTQPCQ